jgi:hypothetical protein
MGKIKGLCIAELACHTQGIRHFRIPTRTITYLLKWYGSADVYAFGKGVR